MKKSIGTFSFLSMFLLFCVSKSTSSTINRDHSNVCRDTGMCHFGGRCDTWGYCRCIFDCNQESWPTTFYCGIKTPAGRQMFSNLCHVLAFACETQTDIPIVKYDENRRQCEDEIGITSHDKLCERPQDFMGPCGATLSLEGNLGAGVCLLDKTHKRTRCQCPANKIGSDCSTRVVPRSVGNGNNDNSGTVTTGYAEAKIALYISVAFVMAAIIVFLVVRRFKSKSRNRSLPCPDDVIFKTSCEKLDAEEAKKCDCDSRTSEVVPKNWEDILKENKLDPSFKRRERLSARSYEIRLDSKPRETEKKKSSSEGNISRNNLDTENNNNFCGENSESKNGVISA